MNTHQFQIRFAEIADERSIGTVLTDAFGGDAEARLVEALRLDNAFICEFVVVCNGKLVGEVLFSRLQLTIDGQEIEAAALAPVAVQPELQRQGLGSLLIETGCAELRERGFEAVIVLGHPGYYLRFGFSAALVRHIQSPYAGDAYMGLELVPGALQGASGKVFYPAPFCQIEE